MSALSSVQSLRLNADEKVSSSCRNEQSKWSNKWRTKDDSRASDNEKNNMLPQGKSPYPLLGASLTADQT